MQPAKQVVNLPIAIASDFKRKPKQSSSNETSSSASSCLSPMAMVPSKRQDISVRKSFVHPKATATFSTNTTKYWRMDEAEDSIVHNMLSKLPKIIRAEDKEDKRIVVSSDYTFKCGIQLERSSNFCWPNMAYGISRFDVFDVRGSTAAIE